MAKVDETTELVEKVDVKKDKKEIKKQAKELKRAAKESKKISKENEKLKKLDKMEAKELKKKKKEKKKGGVLKTVFISFFSTILVCLAIVGIIYYAWTGGFEGWFEPKKAAVET